mgnify:CR=1 FL=1
MQVRELIAKLQRLPADAMVVVSGYVVHDVEVISGKFETGYFSPTFWPDPHGKEKALVFLGNTELANGDVVSVPR